MRFNSRRTWIALAVVVVAAVAFLAFRGRDRAVEYTTTPVGRGDIVDVVGATGTLQAVTTVQVGSQVSGIVDSLDADFNSRVRKNQVIARLETSTFDARLSQAQANLVAARANVEKARATVSDTKQKYERAKELSAEQLLPGLRPRHRAVQLRGRGGRHPRRGGGGGPGRRLRPAGPGRPHAHHHPRAHRRRGGRAQRGRGADGGRLPAGARRSSSSPTTSAACRSTPPSTRPTSGACGRARRSRSTSTPTPTRPSPAAWSRCASSRSPSRTSSPTTRSSPSTIPASGSCPA